MKIGTVVSARASRGAPVTGRIAGTQLDRRGQKWLKVNTAPKGARAVIKLFRPGSASAA